MRHRFFIILLLFVTLMMQAAARKKVALVLSGGGAKGAAHVGVLKVLEEAGIPIDYIVGTSMGAIVGGLYSIGYDAASLDSLVCREDWRFLLSDDVPLNVQSFPQKVTSEKYILSLPFGKTKEDRSFSGVINGQNLNNLFTNLTIGFHDSTDFDKLHIPFACIAVDMVTGKEHVFRRGSLSTAMRASMAIPAVFAPVRVDDMILVDGGINNNYPVDVALSMGAEVVIGVDLLPGKLKTADNLVTASDVIGQIVALHSYDKYTENINHTDLLIRPELTPYSSASFNTAALDTMIRRGEKAARLKWDDLLALKEQIYPLETDLIEAEFYEEPILVGLNDSLNINTISFVGIDPADEKWLRSIIKISENSLITRRELQNMLSILYGTNAYKDVSYQLSKSSNHDLTIVVTPKSISSLNLGVRFDNQEIVSVLLHATLDYRSTFNSRIALTGRVGRNSYGRIDYAIEKNPLRNFSLSYMFDYNDLKIYNLGRRSFNPSYQHHLIEFAYTDVNWLNFQFKTGVRYQYYDFNSMLYSDENVHIPATSSRFSSVFAEAYLETLDSRYFPTKGVSLKGEYSLFIDDFIGNKIETLFSSAMIRFMGVIRLNSHLTLLPSVYGRLLMGEAAFPFQNIIGGEVFGRYLPQQLPFIGINQPEMTQDVLVITKLHLRQRIAKKHYISLIANYGASDNNLFELLQGKSYWGGGLGYAYNSIAGPLSATLSMSNQTVSGKPQPLFYMSLGYSF